MKLILNGGGDGKAAVSARQLLNRVIDHHKKILYIPFAAFVLVAMANSVNLSDGLDGLCAGTSAIFAFFFGARLWKSL